MTLLEKITEDLQYLSQESLEIVHRYIQLLIKQEEAEKRAKVPAAPDAPTPSTVN